MKVHGALGRAFNSPQVFGLYMVGDHFICTACAHQLGAAKFVGSWRFMQGLHCHIFVAKMHTCCVAKSSFSSILEDFLVFIYPVLHTETGCSLIREYQRAVGRNFTPTPQAH